MRNKVVLITGAATGISRETAIAFARKGTNVVISDINAEELENTQKLVKEEGTKVLSIIADVSEADDVRIMVIETSMLDDAGITREEETLEYITSLHPIGRLGKPQEVADAIVWLASDEASFVTGHTLLVDGGYTAQ